jgi:hypothetical protein
MQSVYSVFPEQMLRIGEGVFRNPKPFGVHVVDSTSADDNCISRSSQQGHDEAVRSVRTADGRAASLTLNLVADNPIKGRNEISNDKGPFCGCCTEAQIAIVQLSQTWREYRFEVILVAIDESPYQRHLLPLGCRQ